MDNKLIDLSYQSAIVVLDELVRDYTRLFVRVANELRELVDSHSLLFEEENIVEFATKIEYSSISTLGEYVHDIAQKLNDLIKAKNEKERKLILRREVIKNEEEKAVEKK